MNRTLTASIALAATLGVAGLAHAQGTTPNSNSQGNGMPPSMQTPSTTQPSPSMATPAPSASTPGSAAANPAGQMPTQSTSRAEDPATVQQAQQQLKSQGLYTGPIDGVVGPETKTALSQFQQKNGLPQTASLDQPTLSRLMGGTTTGSKINVAPPGSTQPIQPTQPMGR